MRSLNSLNIEERSTQPPTPGEIRLQAAVLSSLAILAVSFLARFAFGAPLTPELLADFVFSIMPISLVEFGVSLLGPFAKQLGFIGCVVVYFVALTVAAELSLRVKGNRKGFATFALASAASAITLVVLFPAIGAGLAGRLTRHGALSATIWTLVIYAFYGGSLYCVERFYSRPSTKAPQSGWTAGTGLLERTRELVIDRRRLLSWVGYAVVGVACYDIARALITPILQAGAGRVKHGNGRFPNINGLALEITPTADFYEVSKNPSDPEVDERRWKLEIGGLVERPMTFTYEHLKGLAYVEQYATLECISNEVGGSLISNALWRGVRLKDILATAGIKSGVTKIVMRAVDGYSDSIPLDRAVQEGTILAYLINGAPLPQSHGFPMRLIVPGIYGMKNVKWITSIEAVDYDFKGYWQRRGWDDRAEYKTMSRIDAPNSGARGATTIAGIAFAGDRGISKVEVSLDNGKTWEPAEIKSVLSPYTWVLWHKEWIPSKTGTTTLVVRATDGKGSIQIAAHAPPIPDGASGYDRRSVDTT